LSEGEGSGGSEQRGRQEERDGDVDMIGDVEEEEEEDKKLYCTCNAVSWGNMVACDNPGCKREWFHWGCVGLTKEPTGRWYCPECRVKIAK